ncbi:MAG: AsmA-like C-terminal region-containing protein, partial [Acidobacteriota bacterium]
SVEDEAPEPVASGEGEGEFLGDVVAEGTLRIEEGSFRTLDFTGMDAGMKLEGQVVTLDPFRMNLYDGTFQGAATLDLAQDPPSFTVRSDVERLDVNGLLADNLDLDGMISGRFRASLRASGAGADYDAIVRSLAGGGTVLVTQGQVGALDMLDILRQVSGVFGEQTLQEMASRFATEGTPFDRLSATLQLGGGRMRSDNLLLESPDLVLKGKADLDLLAATLDGDLDVVFSSAISRSMRAEGSRAAKAFWDPGKDQVLLPLGLSGPIASPTPSVDWSTAAENVARRELEAEAKKRLGGLGGLVSGGEAGSGSRSEPTPEEAATAGDLVAEIGRVRWGGSFLVKDLKIEGVVRGSNISQASLVVQDGSGRELRRIDRLDEVDSYFGSGVPRSDYASISWDATVDGKVLARAQQPFTVVLTLQDTEGHRVEASTEARR